ncbi:MAG: M48 family metallopeptidase [Phycisphaerae bacterium]|jgi:heat shock protein HtpX|nr:M48 family metallopeptidase [Phycisphaerae bacterium]MDP7289265.1 M48 family metallopeptidase [Phycisphaerae bacterium]
MATETFHTLIAKNRLNSFILIGVFMLFFVGMGLLIGYVWGGGQAAFSVTIAIIAAIVAFVLTLGSYFGGSSVLLGMSGAKEIVHADDPELFNVVEEICLAGGMPLPRIFLINDTAMNAFATGRNPKNASVAITLGLRTKLTRDELQAVMAHEMSHVRNYDILYSMLMAVMVGVLVMLCDFFLRSMFWGRSGRRRSRSSGKDNPLQIVMVVLAVILAIIAPILARIIQMSLSRQREYLADAGSVELTRNPEGLIGALLKLSGDGEVLETANRATAGLYFVHPIKKFEKRATSIFCTHPPINDRVNRLRQLTV